MKLRHALLLAVFLCGAVAAQALTPEERYIQVYTIMREGDGLVVANQGRAALQKYREALDRIRSLQKSDPAWNPTVVSYRLDYLDTRVRKLAAQFPAAEATTATTPAAATEGPAAFVTPAGPPAEVIKALQAETTRLNRENATLQAKLKEALSVQPAAADPRELVKAQEQINTLLKERDLLRVSAEQLRDSSRVVTATSPADKQALAEVQKQVAQQAAVAASLREQNDTLQRQLADARKTVAPGTEPQMATRLQSAQDEIAGLLARNQAMQSEIAALKSVPAAVVSAPAPAAVASGKEIEKLEKQLNKAKAALRSVEEDRDDLKSKYAEARKELKGKLPPDTAATLEEQGRQLTVMRARLDAYEARPVPFTAEELALLKQPATPKMAAASVTDTNLAKRKADLPRGTAPLFNEAERAIDAKRFSDAEEKLKQVLSQDENSIYVLARLSGVQLDLDKPAEAEKNLKKALAMDPRDPACLYLMGSLKLRQEKYDEALDVLSQAVQITPDNPMAQFNLGRALIFKGNLKPAETAFRKAITLKPNWGEAHYQLAVIYVTSNPPFIELAKWHYQKAITGGMPRNFELEKRLEKSGGAKP